jgi:thiosulfate reductase/polysulfide reductase chain A
MNARTEPVAVADPASREVFSLCGMCATRCPIKVTVKDGRIVWLQGNDNDRAMGQSLCARGAAGLPFEYDDERPQYPMLRTGPRGSGEWRRASWDEALDHVAERLKAIIAEHGGQAVALSDRGGPFTDLTKTFLQALGSPNYFDHDATCGRNAHHAARTLFGLGRTALTFDFKNAKHAVLYGRNILESLKVKEAKEFMTALAGGMRCTYIDPRVSVTATKATRYWQIRPHSDYALNLALIHEILAGKLYDAEFVARWVSGLDVLAAAVADYTPEWQAPITGISAAELRAFLAEIVADAPHVIFHPGWMVARNRQSFYVSRTTLILNVLMGAIEVKGGIVLAKTPEEVGRKSLNKLGAHLPKVTAPRVDGVGSEHLHWDPAAGLIQQLFAAIDQGVPYPVAAYIAYRHDPLTSLPDPDRLKAVLDKLPLLVAIDVNYSETAWYSDVLLPESSYLERANILAQNNGGRPNFSLRDQAVAPRFDTRPAWWIFRELLRRLGHADTLDFDRIEDLWAHQLQGTGVTVDDLRMTGVVPLADSAMRYPPDALKFKTPSGKIEFDSSVLTAAGLPSLAPYLPHPAQAGDRFWLLFGRSPVLTHGQSLDNPILAELAPENRLWIHPQRAAALGIADGDAIEVGDDHYWAPMRARVTDWVHPDAVFMLHGYGRTVPLQTRAFNRGVADQKLQHGHLFDYDRAGGGIAMTETVVQVRRANGTRQGVAA